MAYVVLVHSPVVGPSTWGAVAGELRRRGHRIQVPSLVAAALTGRPDAFVAAVKSVHTGEGRPVRVGHSGAGLPLPLIAAGLPTAPAALLFVDAGVPPVSGPTPLMPARFLEELLSLSLDGPLPKWSEWFGPGVMEGLVPDAVERAALVEELPAIPASFLTSQVTVPSDWSQSPAGYLQLSAAYDEEVQEAERRGWPVIRMSGGHLDIATRPGAGADALEALAGTLST